MTEIVSNFYWLLVSLTGFNRLSDTSIFYEVCQKFCLWGAYFLLSASIIFVLWLIFKSFIWLYHLFF